MLSMLIAVVAVSAGRRPILTSQQLYSRVAASVGVVTTQQKLGSAVAVSSNRVVTNWHVVSDVEWALALPQVRIDGRKYAAVLVGLDKDHDIAVLQLLGGDLRVVPPRRSELPNIGERVFAIGAPQGLESTISDGIISNIQTLEGGALLQTTAAISHGSSGGGLFDSEGRLIGITALSLLDGQQINFAIPIDRVDKLLRGLFAQVEVANAIASLRAVERSSVVESLRKDEFASLLRLLPSLASLRQPGPDQSSDSAEIKVPPAPTAEVKHSTPPQSWGHFGWYLFRWGMGPRDVTQRVQDKQGAFQSTVEPTCELSAAREFAINCNWEAKDHSFRLFGLEPVLSFGFFKGELWTTRLQFYYEGHSEAIKVFELLLKKLSAKYGNPSYVFLPKLPLTQSGIGQVDWDVPGMTIELDEMLDPRDEFQAVDLSYQDPIRYEQMKKAPLSPIQLGKH